MKVVSSFFLSFIFMNLCFGQIVPEYFVFIKKADSLYNTKNYLASANMYSEAFKVNGWKGKQKDRYNAACSWALAGNPDSAFFQLEKVAIRMDYDNYNNIVTDVDLTSLREDKRWQPVIELVKQNKERKEVNLNKPLVAKLDTIYQEDQKYRKQINIMEEKYGQESIEVKELWKIIEKTDSINLIKVVSILDKEGWLGPEIIGGIGNTTLFLVIQHADLATQQKYLPMMRKAVSEKKASPSSLALLEDRVALGEGRKQIYGSQIGTNPLTGKNYVLPLLDPDNVDARRTEVGLPPLADYVKYWEITWDVAQYKKDLIMIESLQKK